MAPQGWAKLHGRKFHYYGQDGRALCGRSLAFTTAPAAFEDSNHQHAENCAECQRRKLKQLEAASLSSDTLERSGGEV